MDRIRQSTLRPDPNGWRHLNLASTLLVGFLVGVGQASGLVFWPIDAVIYWRRSADLAHLYPDRMGVGAGDFYLYPPPLAQLLSPFHFVPEPVYWIVSSCVCFGALWYMAGRWTPVLLVFGALSAAGLATPLGIPVMYALLGNVQLLMGAAIIAGTIRHPAWWSVVLLTKTAPGIGLLWFVARREWRHLGVALGATGAVVAVSFALAPSLWFEWASFALRNLDMPTVLPVVPVPFALRLLMSAALLIWGARTERIWTVPIAAGWAVPALYEWSFIPVWLGALRLRTVTLPRPGERRAAALPISQPA
jgi:hypothetical protein